MLDGLRIEGRENGRGGSIRQQTSLLTAVCYKKKRSLQTAPLLSFPPGPNFYVYNGVELSKIVSYSGYDLLEGVGSLRVGGETNFNLSRM